MKSHRGFTLLELLMVVIIIGILASIALPQYIRASERARAASALAFDGAVRSSEMRFAAQDPNNVYTPVLGQLDITIPVPIGWRTPTFSLTPPPGGGAPGTGFVTLTRNGGQFDGNTLGIQFGTGTVCGTFTVYDATLLPCVED